MGARGRKSAAELAVIGPGGIQTIRRPEPPSELTGEQADEWRRMVNAYPADHFDQGKQALLVQHCRHTVAARRFAQLIEAECDRNELEIPALDKLHAMQERESRILASIAVRMGTAHSTAYDKRKPAKKGGGIRPPWEIVEG